MISVTVMDRNDEEFQEAFATGQTLMKALKAAGYEIQAICGGIRACATCHVYVAPEWFPRTGEPSEDEVELLEYTEGYVQASSRLSCQINLGQDLDGLKVALAPED
jgi:2Fe-2S ferredoxin